MDIFAKLEGNTGNILHLQEFQVQETPSQMSLDVNEELRNKMQTKRS